MSELALWRAAAIIGAIGLVIALTLTLPAAKTQAFLIGRMNGECAAFAAARAGDLRFYGAPFVKPVARCDAAYPEGE